MPKTSLGAHIVHELSFSGGIEMWDWTKMG